jgi:hypothetical protein
VHFNDRDDFTGEIHRGFYSTDREKASNRASYLISHYDKDRNMVTFVVMPNSGATACDKKYLLLKDSTGVIHKLDADQSGVDGCAVLVDANLVRKPFKVRIPMWGGGVLDIVVDTTALDLSKL